MLRARLNHTLAAPGGRGWGVLRPLELADGSTLIVRDSAPDEESGPLVMAVHGLGGSDQGLRSVIAPIAAEGTRVVAVNLPGMGVTRVQSQRGDLDFLLGLIVEVIEVVSPGEPVVLVGHSFGATLVAHLAARYAQLVSQLVLLCPVTIAPARRHGRRAALSVKGADAWQQLCAKLPTPWGHWALLVGGIASNTALTRQGIGGRVRISRGSVEKLPLRKDLDYFFLQHLEASRHDVGEVAEQVTVPVTIVSGTKDPFAPGETVVELAKIMGARLVRVKGAGHLAQHEDPAPLVKAVRDAVEAART